MKFIRFPVQRSPLQLFRLMQVAGLCRKVNENVTRESDCQRKLARQHAHNQYQCIALNKSLKVATNKTAQSEWCNLRAASAMASHSLTGYGCALRVSHTASEPLPTRVIWRFEVN